MAQPVLRPARSPSTGSSRSEYSPREAIEAGVSVIYQHFSLVPSLTVADNIFLGTELQTGLRIDRAKQLREATALLAPMRAADQGKSTGQRAGRRRPAACRDCESASPKTKGACVGRTNGRDRRARGRAAGCSPAQAPRRGSGDHVRYSSARGGFLDRRSGDSPARREDRALTGSEKHRAGTAHRGDLAGVVASDSSVAAGCGARQGGLVALDLQWCRRRRRRKGTIVSAGFWRGRRHIRASRIRSNGAAGGHLRPSKAQCGGFVMRDGSRYQPGRTGGSASRRRGSGCRRSHSAEHLRQALPLATTCCCRISFGSAAG